MKRMRAAENSVTIRVRKHREQLRAAGLKPVQLWLPDTSLGSFRRKCKRESLSLQNDPQEADVLDWIEKVTDTSGWV